MSTLPPNAGKFSYFQGKIVPTESANVNIMTHGLQYGTACFGGIRAYWNESQNQLFIFRLKDHYDRLVSSCKILQLQMPLGWEEFRDTVLELTRKNGWKQNVYYRPFIYKNQLTLSPRLHDISDDLAIYTLGLDDYMDTKSGLKTMVSSWRRISDDTIPTRSKANGGYINSALAKSEAVQNGMDEAIFLNKEGKVSEGSAENIFIVRDGKLVTPSLDQDILEGITRRSLIEIAQKEIGLEVVERSVGRTELYVAEEAFFSGTGVQLAWIREIDRRKITDSPGSVTSRLQELFFSIVKGENPTYSKWLTHVYPAN